MNCASPFLLRRAHLRLRCAEGGEQLRLALLYLDQVRLLHMIEHRSGSLPRASGLGDLGLKLMPPGPRFNSPDGMPSKTQSSAAWVPVRGQFLSFPK